MFDCGPVTDTGNESVIAEILVQNSRGVFRGKVGQDGIYEGAMFIDLGLYLVGSLIICVRLRVSSLDCRSAGVLKHIPV